MRFLITACFFSCKKVFYAINVIYVVVNINIFLGVHSSDAFSIENGNSGTPLVPSNAAGTMLLCTHRAAPTSWIKIKFIPAKFVYGWTSLCARLCKELSLCINTLSKPKLEASSVKTCTGLTTNCT